MFTKQLFCGLLLLVVCAWAVSAEPPTAETPKELSKIAGWKGTGPKADDAFTFVVMSDRTGGHMEGAWAAAVEKVNLLQPDFVMCVGDLIEGYSEDEATLTQQWDEFEALTKKFQAPFFYCPGNHDISNDVMLKIYCERHGVNSRSYYSFNYRGCHFVVLDSYSALSSEAFADEQFAWLANDLSAEKDAKYVFVFYHHPLWDKPKMWNRLRAILPAGKTTIFNGHDHQLGFREVDGITTCRLGATAAHSGKGLRTMGRFLMFAHVAVNEGQPNIAVLAVDQVFPTRYAQHVTKLQKLSLMNIHCRAISPRGGHFMFRQENPLEVPITAVVTWEAQGWDVSPPSGQFPIDAGGVVEQKFNLIPKSPAPLKPKIMATYKFKDPYWDQATEVKREVEVGTYAETEIPRVVGIKVDGELGDFAAVKPLRIADASRIYTGLEHWSGAEDGSFELRVATDGKRLFVAVDVTDDQIYLDSPRHVWLNDAVEFYWDARSPEKRDGRHGDGTGQVILVVPAEGAEPRPQWNMGTRTTPEGLLAACKRRKGGYVYEFSFPLSELGARTPLAAGQEFRLELRLDDGDLRGDQSTSTRMTTSGVGHNYWYTSSYVRCTFK